MPIRAFVTQSLEQLAVTIAALETALQSGQLNELRAAGIMTRTGKIDVERAYRQARYEAFLRAQFALHADPAFVPNVCQQTGLAPATVALLAQWPDPYREEVRHVESITKPTATWNGNFLPPNFLP